MNHQVIREITHNAPWFLPLLSFVVGAMIGSFLNVCLYRLPKGESVVTPGSHCACGQPVAWYDNVPILSWLILRGRARCCGRAFSFRYAFVELLTGFLFFLAWCALPPEKAVSSMLLIAILVCATFFDIDHMMIPDFLTIGGAATGVLVSFLLPAVHDIASATGVTGGVRSATDALLGLLLGSAVGLWLAFVAEWALGKEAFGFGDIKLLGTIGAFLGWKGAVFALFGGAIAGCLWILGATAWSCAFARTSGGLKVEAPTGESAQLGLGVQISFGPMLAIGAITYLLFAHNWIDPQLNAFAREIAFG